MKTLLFILLFILISVSSMAQKTKEEQNLEKSKKAVIDNFKSNIPLTYQSIKKQAEDKWQSDYVMVENEIWNQLEAWFKIELLKANEPVLDLNEEISKMKFAIIVGTALDKWSNKKFGPCVTNLSGIDEQSACMKADWVMALFEINSQIDMYKQFLNK
jgi:hypothetical protein